MQMQGNQVQEQPAGSQRDHHLPQRGMDSPPENGAQRPRQESAQFNQRDHSGR